MVNRIEEAAETTSFMIFLRSIGPTAGKLFPQAGVNWGLGPFLPWDVYVYPMGAQWRKHDDQVSCVESSSLTLPGDPCKTICLELWFTHPSGKQLEQSSSDKLHRLSADVHRL
jgi:hypothetical protein